MTPIIALHICQAFVFPFLAVHRGGGGWAGHTESGPVCESRGVLAFLWIWVFVLHDPGGLQAVH